jgi:hypothetical protein
MSIKPQKYMPKKFLGGPVREKKYFASKAFFFSTTPQVLYWAYISG